MQYQENILITGGAGFIGSHVVCHMVRQYPHCRFYNLDNLSYAADLKHLQSVERADNYDFIKGDLNDVSFVKRLFKQRDFDAVIHLAAESHVDNSIEHPLRFAQTNIMGTLHLLEVAKKQWGDELKNKRFYHISTDEVFGSLGTTDFFTENSPYQPNSPYAASKASSDHFVRAYGATFGLPYVISNCSNNYGPHQHEEKLIPLCIQKILKKQPIPLYGDGSNVRDWLYVQDHVRAIDAIFHHGKNGETYAIGGGTTSNNQDLINLLCDQMDQKLNRPQHTSRGLITYVTDRKGHDFRYAINGEKIADELGWRPTTTLEEGLSKTIDWYLKKLNL